MKKRPLARAIVVACVLAMARVSAAADDATLFRVFLTDGSSLVSYGELARVGDRVVFSMPTAPTASTPNPPLHLINLAADRVDWEHTDRYAESARAAHYIATRADDDYVALSNSVALTLNEVAFTPDPARRLAIVERARRALAEWPRDHFNHRAGEVRQMLAMLDEAIADLRAAAGEGRFDLSLAAYVDPPAIVEPLLPGPTPKETIEQMLTAARLAELPVERQSLLAAAIVSLDRDAASLPADWVAATRLATKTAIDEELRVDQAYQVLADRFVTQATARARLADVRGIETMLTRVPVRDAALGGKRPEMVGAIVAAVQAQLDVARQLRLARDRWAMRLPHLRQYRVAMRLPIEIFTTLRAPLENIKSLAGSTQGSLALVQREVSQLVQLAAAIAPPEEFRAAHALLVSAAQLADSAARIRREATLSGDMARAWDASSAAAGALMLGARARSDIQALMGVPQLR